jgi:hypothetical protein
VRVDLVVLGLAAVDGLHVEDAGVHGASVQIDSAVVSVLASVEAQGSPPGFDELLCALIVPLEASRGPGGARIRIKGLLLTA